MNTAGNSATMWRARAVAALQAAHYLIGQLQALIHVCEGSTDLQRVQAAALARGATAAQLPGTSELPEDTEPMDDEAKAWKARAIAAIEVADELARALNQLAESCLSETATLESIKDRAVSAKVHLHHPDRDWAWGMIRYGIHKPRQNEG